MDKKKKQEDSNNSEKKSQPDSSASLPATQALEPIENEAPTAALRTHPPGHGRLPHSAYTDAIEHNLAIVDFKAGDSCPEHCGGRLYRYEPGVLVRIKGQNLASVHKYWIEKLRCGTCGYLLSAKIPEAVGADYGSVAGLSHSAA